MSTVATFEDLRGATLDHVDVDWRNASLLISFLPSAAMAESCALRAHDVSRVEVARAADASRVVRLVRRVARPSGEPARVEIVLESGDVVAFEAVGFAVDLTGG